MGSIERNRVAIVSGGVVGALLVAIVFVDGIDAIVYQGLRPSWWTHLGTGAERELHSKYGRAGFGFSRGLPTRLFGVSEVCGALTIIGVCVWAFTEEARAKTPTVLFALATLASLVLAGMMSFVM